MERLPSSPPAAGASMNPAPIHCLILACGNNLRSDDGVGVWLADWAEWRFRDDPRVRIVACQQWTPELAADIARASAVLFLDCSLATAPGSVALAPVASAAAYESRATHHLGAPQLLALTRELYHAQPAEALLLAIGAGSTELGEHFSDPVAAALPQACRAIEDTIQRFLGGLPLPL